jgi:hypothetical protein
LQAQEYLRTFKLDLFWTGVTEARVRELMRLEIPYRKATEPFATPTYTRVYEQLHRADLQTMLHSYFLHTRPVPWKMLRSTLKRGGFLCVFVGNPTVDGIEVETWRIIAEYFEPKGFELHKVFRDDIKTRQLFRKRKNKNPRGMDSEYLLVMRKQ